MDVMTLSYLGDETRPRGIRNNNPGNIEKGPSPWRGKVPLQQNTDGRFEQFERYVYGVRAMIKLIRDTYIGRDGLNTVASILQKYAPSFENPTGTYIQTVANNAGVGTNEPLNTDQNTMRRLIQSMANFENGVTDAIPDPVFNAAWKLA